MYRSCWIEDKLILKKILKFWRHVGKRSINNIHDAIQPQVISRDNHVVSRKDISNNALKVLSRLNKAGFEAYLVGGSVRDLLLGRKPKDFDIATDATPDEVKSLFRNCRLIGRRFRLAHVLFGRDVIEVATFRGHHKPEHQLKNQSKSGMLLRDNVYGTIEEDVLRRDFTVNALYYSIKDFSILDFVGGLQHINERKLHLIGDTEVRYREDPVRMLRAVRLAAKLDLAIDDDSVRLIPELKSLITDVSNARLWDESLKLFLSGHASKTLAELRRLDLFSSLFPLTAKAIENDENASQMLTFIEQGLTNTDLRIEQNKPVTPAFLYACFLWPAVLAELGRDLGKVDFEKFNDTCHRVILEQSGRITIPRRFSTLIKEIWTLQLRLPRRFGKRAEKLMAHPRFRAAYDFLLLRESSGEVAGGLGQWWTDFQEADETNRKQMMRDLQRSGPKKPRRRRSRKTSTNAKPSKKDES